MQTSRDQIKAAYARKNALELASLASRGLCMSGNAASDLLFLKGSPSEAELAGAEALSGPDGAALKASAARLGYPPQDFCALLAVKDDGEPVPPALLREAVVALDPATLILCDDAAVAAVHEAYAPELVALPDITQAMLEPGVLVQILGMRVLALGNFAAALESGDSAQKQLMWHRLKLVPPLGEPY